MKKNSKKGFTLAELLVVVAIIAVLTAVAIPVFSASKDKAQNAVYQANARSAYAQAMIGIVSGGLSTVSDQVYKIEGDTYTVSIKNGNEGTVTVNDKTFTFGG